MSLYSRVLPPPEPPLACLTAESEQQAAIAAARAHALTPTGETGRWKDPYGPDRVVFGPYRKACVEDADYGL